MVNYFDSITLDTLYSAETVGCSYLMKEWKTNLLEKFFHLDSANTLPLRHSYFFLLDILIAIFKFLSSAMVDWMLELRDCLLFTLVCRC